MYCAVAVVLHTQCYYFLTEVMIGLPIFLVRGCRVITYSIHEVINLNVLFYCSSSSEKTVSGRVARIGTDSEKYWTILASKRKCDILLGADYWSEPGISSVAYGSYVGQSK